MSTLTVMSPEWLMNEDGEFVWRSLIRLVRIGQERL